MTGTCQRTMVPVLSPEVTVQLPPIRSARSCMFSRPLPRRWLPGMPSPSSLTTSASSLVGVAEGDLHLARPCVAGHVAERLAHHGRHLGGGGLVDGVEHADEVQRGAEAQHAGRLVDQIVHHDPDGAAGAALAGQPEDGGAQLADGVVLVVEDALDLHLRGVGHGGQHALQRQARSEQTLDDRVVQVAGDALVVFGQQHALTGGGQVGVGLAVGGDVADGGDDHRLAGHLRRSERDLDGEHGAVLALGGEVEPGTHGSAVRIQR